MEGKKTDKQNLYEKLLAVQSEARPIPKNGLNKSQGYKYVRSEDVINAARILFLKHGLVVTMKVPGHKQERYDRVNDKGVVTGSAILSNVDISAIVTDANTGYFEDFSFPGTGWDTTDKAVYKAITGGIKYAYLSLMNVSTGDDPEDEGDGEKRKPATIQRPSQGSPPQGNFDPNAVVGFGKHTKEKWCDVPAGYLKWLAEQSYPSAETAKLELQRRLAEEQGAANPKTADDGQPGDDIPPPGDDELPFA